MRIVLSILAFFLFSCGNQKPPENPTTCEIKDVPEGVQFTCTDKNGNVTTGIVKNGERGAPGQPGQPGQPGTPGQNGEGLKVVADIRCSGAIEGWMENSSYRIDFQLTSFESGDQFLASTTKLLRGDEMINSRSASMFYLQGSSLKPSLSDGQFTMVYGGSVLSVKSQGGISAEISCKESI